MVHQANPSAAAGATGPLRAIAADVVGREAELEAISRLLDDPAAGPRALLLEGAPGAGKTTLWRAGLEILGAGAGRVLACCPAETEASLPFSALGDLLEPLLDEELDALPEPQRVALEVALQRVAPSDRPTNRFAVSLAVRGTLTRPAAGITAVAIDDLQWLDEPSLQALEFGLRRLGAAPVRLLLFRRDGRGAPFPFGLERACPVERLGIAPLEVDELDRLVVSRLGTQLPRPRLVELHRTSGGNPYFALEIVRSLTALKKPLAWDAPLPVPESIGALLRSRLDALSPRAREALLLAAAAAHPTAVLLENVTGSSEGLREAVSAGILERDGERLRFTHPLLASVASERAGAAERRHVHGRLAAAATGEERALHLALAAVEPDEAIVGELDAAAANAHRRGAPAAAAELADHARRLTPADRPAELTSRAASSAEYHLAAGNTDRGRALLEHAFESTPPGPVRARLLLRLGHVRYLVEDVSEAHGLFEAALRDAGEDRRLTAETLQALAFTAMYGGDIPKALAYARSARDIAEQLGDPALLALAFCRVALNEFLAGHGLDRALMERAVELEPHISDIPVEQLPSYAYAGVCMYADDLETARSLYLRLYTTAVDEGDERALATLLFPMSQLECAAGDLGLADRYAAEAVERARQSDLQTLAASALSARAYARALVGRVVDARAAAEEGIALAGAAGAVAPLLWNTAAVGFLELSVGDAAAAHARLGPLSDAVVAVGLAEPGAVRFLPDEIEALIALGEHEAARPLVRLLEDRGRALDRVWALATAARSSALLAAAKGDFAAARASVAEALIQHERLPHPFELGRTLLVQGSIERRDRHRKPAREAFERALEIFDSLGAALWAEKAAAELARIPGRAPASGELSETERRVAELVAEGLTNKEVAARLFVTVRTVESNLSKVYAKLGIRSRTALAGRLGPRA